jgi:hypothetical protein
MEQKTNFHLEFELIDFQRTWHKETVGVKPSQEQTGSQQIFPEYAACTLMILIISLGTRTATSIDKKTPPSKEED